MDSMRYMVEEMHVDGFRLDLATSLARVKQEFSQSSGFLMSLRQDEVLQLVKIAAEPWDVGIGGYQLGAFPPGSMEWNDRYRDVTRRFWRGDERQVGELASRLSGSSDIFGPSHRTIWSTVNYLTVHDGMTLNDLVSYNHKHNYANGEDNRDGTDANWSYNSGVEGFTENKEIVENRKLRQRAMMSTLLLSFGTPIIRSGDEFLNTQFGNNNAYCQDNSIGWIDWRGLRRNASMLAFVKKAVALRKAHPVLHMSESMKEADYLGKGFPDMSFHGERAWFCNMENTSRMIGVMLCGAYAKLPDGSEDDFLYTGYNFHWETRDIALPNLPEGMEWKKVMDTGDLTCDGFYGENGQVYERAVEVGPRTVVVLQGVKKPEPERKHTGKGKKNEKLPGAEAKKTAASDNTVTEAENKERRSGDNASMASL